MGIGQLGFLLVVWFPGALHAQSGTQSCRAPQLDGGYFVPGNDVFEHESNLTYACDEGRRPVVEGWWATSTCRHGKWVHEPQCIGENDCFPPDIPNGKYDQEQSAWYKESFVISITCNDGYLPVDWQTTAECVDGTWSSVLACEKSFQACYAPPVIPHAVIISQGYQDVFVENSEVEYQCEDGFFVNRADNKSSIRCIDGRWTAGPPCSNVPEPNADSVCGMQPSVPHSTVEQTDPMTLKYTCTSSFFTLVGSQTVVCNLDGTWSPSPVCKGPCVINPPSYKDRDFVLSAIEYMVEGESKAIPCTTKGHVSLFQCANETITHTECRGETGPSAGHEGSTESGAGGAGGAGGADTPPAGSGTQAAGGGSSSTPDRQSGPSVIDIGYCGTYPNIPNADVEHRGPTFLKYKCRSPYTLVGMETVACYRDGTWSPLPVCKASCVINSAQFNAAGIQHSGGTMEEGDMRVNCIWQSYYSVFQCKHGQFTFSACCYSDQHSHGRCQWHSPPTENNSGVGN